VVFARGEEAQSPPGGCRLKAPREHRDLLSIPGSGRHLQVKRKEQRAVRALRGAAE